MSSPTVRRPTLPTLTALRFAAALAVVLYHRGVAPAGPLDGAWGAVFGVGYLGVGLFFVLSGFILVYTYLGGSGAAADAPRGAAFRRDFWVARLARVYPMHLVGLALAAPFFLKAFLNEAATGVPVLRRAAAAALGSLTMTQAWLPDAACRWNCPSWSVSVEAFFYLGFPPLLAVLVRYRTRVLLALALAVWVIGLLPAIGYALTDPDGVGLATTASHGRWLTVLKYAPLAHLHEFLLGMAAGVLTVRYGARRATLHWSAVVGVAVVLGLLVVRSLGATGVYPLLHTGLLAPLAAWLVLALAGAPRAVARVAAHRLPTRLGESSYALYIVHIPIWEWLRVVTERLEWYAPTSGAYLGAYLLAACTTAYVAWRYIETPARLWLRGRLAGRTAARVPDVPVAGHDRFAQI